MVKKKDNGVWVFVVFGFLIGLAFVVIIENIVGVNRIFDRDIIKQEVCEYENYNIDKEVLKNYEGVIGYNRCVWNDYHQSKFYMCYFWKENNCPCLNNYNLIENLCKENKAEFGEVQNYYYCKGELITEKVCTTQKEICWGECSGEKCDLIVYKNSSSKKACKPYDCKQICQIQYEKVK